MGRDAGVAAGMSKECRATVGPAGAVAQSCLPPQPSSNLAPYRDKSVILVRVLSKPLWHYELRSSAEISVKPLGVGQHLSSMSTHVARGGCGAFAPQFAQKRLPPPRVGYLVPLALGDIKGVPAWLAGSWLWQRKCTHPKG